MSKKNELFRDRKKDRDQRIARSAMACAAKRKGVLITKAIARLASGVPVKSSVKI